MSAKLTTKDPILVAGFRSLKTGRDVAALLEVSYSQLTYYLYRKPLVSSYREFFLIKKNGGKRLISAPISPLKIIQEKLSYILQKVYIPKSCVHGFIMDRSIMTNAQTHVRRGCILNIDIKDFFPAINFCLVFS